MKHFCSFSEAIREGAKIRPQGYGKFFEDGKTCAFGAGREAIDPSQPHYSEIYRLYPYLDLRAETVECPACNSFAHALAGVMFHLNDDHRWTREAIADWLESEEEKLGFVTISESEERSSSPELVAVGV